MNYFIKEIKVNKLFHLNNFSISIKKDFPHLIITGKNGSGKTVLLNAISEYLQKIGNDQNLNFLEYKKVLEITENQLSNATNDIARRQAQNNINFYKTKIDDIYGKVELEIDDITNILGKFHKGQFIMAFYKADRKSEMIEPKNPTKPTYNKNGKVDETVTNQFLNFLSDLKIQEALARNEKLLDDAENINKWFVSFEELLQKIFQDDELKLNFNYKNYSFTICTEGKSFKFTEMSDGFAAVLDIVTDLIQKMQDGDSLSQIYEKEGIVLIDEIETHLHLGLQKIIMPLLTKIFPNIQFIVTTHSPFILNSMKDASAFDLEHRKYITDLTEYSYESLTEGYFGVNSNSSYLEMEFDQLKELLNRNTLNESDKMTIKQLLESLDKVSESVSPQFVGKFRTLKLKYSETLKKILG